MKDANLLDAINNNNVNTNNTKNNNSLGSSSQDSNINLSDNNVSDYSMDTDSTIKPNYDLDSIKDVNSNNPLDNDFSEYVTLNNKKIPTENNSDNVKNDNKINKLLNNGFNLYNNTHKPNDDSQTGLKNIKLDNKFISDTKNFVLNFILPLINFVTIIALIFLIILPISKKYNENKDKLAVNTELVSDLRIKSNKLQEISFLQNVFNDYYLLVEKALVSSQQVPELLTVIDEVAKNSGLFVKALNYSISRSSIQDLDYSTVDVSLNVTGNLDQLITFFEQSENAIRIFNIDTFRFSYNQESRLFDVSFLIRSPYLEVNSVAVTDDPINLNLDDPEFTRFINRLSGMTYYNPNELVLIEPVETVQEEQVTEDESNNEEINQVEQTVEQQANVEQVVSTNPEQIVGQ